MAANTNKKAHMKKEIINAKTTLNLSQICLESFNYWYWNNFLGIYISYACINIIESLQLVKLWKI